MLTINLIARDSDLWVKIKKKATLRAAQDRYRLRHLDDIRARSRKNQKYNREYRFHWSLKNKYEITFDEYSNMVISQSGRCAICRIESDDLHIDHDHDSGQVRGLLCPQCNQALGMFRDTPGILKEAAKYLETSSTKMARKILKELNSLPPEYWGNVK